MYDNFALLSPAIQDPPHGSNSSLVWLQVCCIFDCHINDIVLCKNCKILWPTTRKLHSARGWCHSLHMALWVCFRLFNFDSWCTPLNCSMLFSLYWFMYSDTCSCGQTFLSLRSRAHYTLKVCNTCLSLAILLSMQCCWDLF